MPAETLTQEPELTAEETTTIPRWSAEFDPAAFDVAAVFREAAAQKKSVGKLLKSLGYPIAEFISAELPEVKSAGGIPVTASTTASDLEADAFSLESLGQMRAAAVGSTVFLNHEYAVPEDVYGKVESAEVAKRAVPNPLAGGRSEQMHCLDMVLTPVGDTENPRAVQVTNMLRKSQLRLGVSVTVLVLAFKDLESGGRLITRVFYLETSIVGIPCNQTAWVNVEKAKALAPSDAAQKSLQTMPEQTTKSGAVTGAQPPGTPKSASFFASALVAAKALFADILEQNRNNYWILSDSFRTAYSRLTREARGKSGDALAAIHAEADASVDEFAAELKALLTAEIDEAAASETTACSPYYEYWSAVGRLQGVLQKGVAQKSGARNSSADQALLNQAHDCIVEAGGLCSHKSAETDGGDETKQASLPAHGDHQTKIASLEGRVAELSSQLGLALDTAETLEAKLKEEQALSKAAVDALEVFSREPLPRAGAAAAI
jgi:hypothetical protein